jgi:hypothetical protein
VSVERRRLFGFEEASAFAGMSGSGTSRWKRAGTNTMRGSAPETAYGHAAGEKL